MPTIIIIIIIHLLNHLPMYHNYWSLRFNSLFYYIKSFTILFLPVAFYLAECVSIIICYFIFYINDSY